LLVGTRYSSRSRAVRTTRHRLAKPACSEAAAAEEEEEAAEADGPGGSSVHRSTPTVYDGGGSLRLTNAKLARSSKRPAGAAAL
jgi:hypothetical protein